MAALELKIEQNLSNLFSLNTWFTVNTLFSVTINLKFSVTINLKIVEDIILLAQNSLKFVLFY